MSFWVGCSAQEIQENPVKLGAEVLLDQHLSELKGKRVGLLMNPSSRVDGTHMVDTLRNLGVNITALYAAEHGFRGEAGAGEKIEDGIDIQTGLPVYSLYGSTRKPTPEMLENVDVVLLDLPDMGLRFYTYNSTMGLMLEAISEQEKELWILDRPNPLGGSYVAGWMLREKYKSFVGSYPIPIAYGLTMGEMARLIVGEEYLKLDQKPGFKVIETKGWKRNMMWPETGLGWIPPSPNLPTFEHLYAYAGTVIFEGTNLSEGRGTEDPFLNIGSPTFQVPGSVLDSLSRVHNVKLSSKTFSPESKPGVAAFPKLEGEKCHGIRISFNGNYLKTDPLKLGIDLLKLAKKYDPNFKMHPFANNLWGIDIKGILDANQTIPDWEKDVLEFNEIREKYLIYE
ncbi:MAG: DUF1343 domain-containing protein [Gracilimonas sp.]|nr:DUF1343 domain-containing protein [Gracilimonas sp.]